MKKGLLKSDKMGDYEKEKGFASYRTLVEYFIGDIVLCNNIAEIDLSIWDNLLFDLEDENGDMVDIYQYFLCNLNEWQREQAKEHGLLLTYSYMLECDVLVVDHFGTSWDYVLTCVKLFDTYDELKQWEESETRQDD